MLGEGMWSWLVCGVTSALALIHPLFGQVPVSGECSNGNDYGSRQRAPPMEIGTAPGEEPRQLWALRQGFRQPRRRCDVFALVNQAPTRQQRVRANEERPAV
jgi:hypothetical protein